MKKRIVLLLAIVMLLSLAACGGEKSSAYAIPDVFGISYTDAVNILEADGFEVSAVEAGVDSFSDKLLYHLDEVDKGTVFKVDDYIIDGNGNLTKNYDIWYDGELVSADKSVIIYYAKEDFAAKNDAVSANPSTEASSEPTIPEQTEEKNDNTEESAIDSEFKAAMDSYEKFFDEYVAIMKKYKENPADMSILTDYATYMGQYADTMQKLDEWESKDMTAAEAAYYVDVQTRITKKLLEVAG